MSERLPNSILRSASGADNLLAHLRDAVAELGWSLSDDSAVRSKDRTGVGFISWDPPALHPLYDATVVASRVDSRTLCVTLSARGWSTVNPTYTEYVKGLTAGTKPVLARVNRSQGTRYRLAIESEQSLRPRLPPTVARAFKAFATGPNYLSLDSLSWNAFYGFVRACHFHHVKLREEDVRELLMETGCPTARARELARIYGHGRLLLQTPVPDYVRSDKLYQARTRLRRAHLPLEEG